MDALKSRPMLRQLCGGESSGDFPVGAILTSASVHDSQVASLYDLMDSADDAPQMPAFSRAPGQVPIIDPNPQGGEKISFAPAEAQRFKERSASERVNSLLKERHGGPEPRAETRRGGRSFLTQTQKRAHRV
jgi:hypothetical protein